MSDRGKMTHDDMLKLAIANGNAIRSLIDRARESMQRDAMTWAVSRGMPEDDANRAVEGIMELFDAVTRNQHRQ